MNDAQPSSTLVEGDRIISDHVHIQATPAEVFAVISDPRRHGDFDGSETVGGAIAGPDLLEMGSKFGMKMKVGPLPYVMRSKVHEYEPDRLIAWGHFGGHRWRYELEPVDGATLVTESFDWSNSMSPAFIEKSGYPERHKRNIRQTLDRLKKLIESSA